MTNSADPDQLVSLEANWSTLFAKAGHSGSAGPGLRPWSDCVDAHVGKDLPCLNMWHKGPFVRDKHHSKDELVVYDAISIIDNSVLYDALTNAIPTIYVNSRKEQMRKS